MTQGLPPAVLDLPAPLIGRDADLRRLEAIFERVTKEGEARAVSVVGPAGMGKTRLVDEYLRGRKPSEPEVRAYWGVPRSERLAYGLFERLLRSRFGILLRLEFYTEEELRIIVERSAEVLGVPIDPDGASEIALRSRGTPRIANRLLRRVRDYAQVRGTGVINRDAAHAALTMLGVDPHGFDEIDRKLLLTIIEKYDGGPVGLGTLAATLAEEEDALEEVYEPFLIQIGFLDRTPRGRVATRLAYEHFGLNMPSRQPGLF